MRNPFSYRFGLPSPFYDNEVGFFTPFSPADLFSTTAIGIWLDPSDLTTMFSDRAGSTAVTTPGTVVGLRLDKSKGLVLGSELVSNPGPFTVTTGWTGGNNASVAISGSKLRVSGNGVSAFPFAYAAVSTVVGRGYAVSAIATFVSGSNDNAYLEKSDSTTGSSNNVATATGPARTITFYFTATATTTYIRLGSANNNDVNDWDNISVRELAGNHAVAPTDAARPIYGVEPKGGRRNLYTQTADLTNLTNWPTSDIANGSRSGAGVSVTTSEGYAYIARPNNADTFTSGVTYTLSATIVCDQTIANVPIRITSGGPGRAAASALVSMTPGVSQRIALTFTASATGAETSRFGIDARDGVVPGGSNATGYVVTFSDPQLELGSTATNYQRVTTAYDITESGVATCHYVQYDGSDDSMSTAAIDFTGTDKMSVFAGIRRITDTVGVIAELSADVNTNARSFLLLSGTSIITGVGPGFNFSSRGSAAASVSQVGVSPTTFTPPVSAVITATGNISGDLSSVRGNGVAGTNGTGDQGTGTYGNYPLFFGRRNNAGSSFNGRDYGIIVVGKAASAGEITDTELWLSDKTAEVDVAKSISPNIYTRSGDTILDRANSIIERRTV